MNMLQEHIREFINPFPNRYTRGQYEIRVLPHDDLDYDGVEKFWRLFKKFPLRSMSQGRAQYSMFFDHYAKVPQNVQDEVTKKIAG